MASATIELECPSCGQFLELDAGFAGGVCRCSSCGGLMTVPSDPASARPERLSRPDTPETVEAVATDAAGSQASAGETTYTTESGRTVKVEESKVPTAGARKAARRVTATLFVVVLLVIVGAAALGVMLVTGGGGETTEQLVEEFGYDPDANPFLAEEANVLGLPLNDGDAVVLDASSSSDTWLGLAGENLARAIGNLRGGAEIAAVLATDAGPRWLTAEAELVKAGTVETAALREEVDALRGMGRGKLGPTVAAAAALEVDRLLLVVGRPVNHAEAASIADALGDDPPRLDVVLVDVEGFDASDLATLATRTGGRAIEIPPAKLARWYREQR